MDEYVIADLKQFIAGAITQQTSDLHVDLHGVRQDLQKLTVRVDGLESRIGGLETKVDDGFSAIADILEDINTRHSNTEARLKDHGQRITHLEQRTA
jgi:uncharacterized protein YoxC